jgi:hypothetical protein
LVFLGFEAALRRSDWRWLLLGGVAFALQVAGGFFLWPLYTGLTLGLYAILLAGSRAAARRALWPALSPVLGAAGIGVIGLGLSAPLWILTAELFQHTDRVHDLFPGVFVPVAEAARLLVPHLWGLPLHGATYHGFHNFVEANLSVGAVPLLLAVAAVAATGRRRPLILAAIGIVAYLAIFGIPPASQLMALVNPTFFKTFPGRVFFITAFGLAVATGIGADWLDRERPGRLLRGMAAAAAVTAGGLLGGAAAVQLHGLPEKFTFTRLPSTLLDPHTPPGRGVLLAVTALLAAAAVLWAWSGTRPRRWPGPALVAIVAAELYALGIGFNPSFPSSMTFPQERSLAALSKLIRNEGQPVRMLNVPTRMVVPGQMPMVWDLPVPTGYSSWLLRRYAAYARLIPGETGGELEVYFTEWANPLLDALNLRFIYAPSGDLLGGTDGVRLDQRLAGARIWSHFVGGVRAVQLPVQGRVRPVILASGPTAIAFRLQVPAGGRLLTAVGLDPEAWGRSDGMIFKVMAGGVAPANPTIRFKIALDPGRRLKDRRFLPVEVDLSDLAGATAELTLITGPGPAGDATFDWGTWVEPRIVDRDHLVLELLVDGPNRIYRNHRALPRAWLVHRVVEVGPGDLGLARSLLAAGAIQPAVEAVVEGKVGTRLGAHRPDDEVRVTSYAAERVELEVTCAEPALLVMSDMVYPGWRATVDGVERPILPTNLIMRGVAVAAGKHRVVFDYRPAGLKLGLWLAALTLAGIVVALAVSATVRRWRHVRAGPDELDNPPGSTFEAS